MNVLGQDYKKPAGEELNSISGGMKEQKNGKKERCAVNLQIKGCKRLWTENFSSRPGEGV